MINFTKMQALGNDFVVINNLQGDISFKKEEIKKLANRNFGIGFDQMLIVEKSIKEDIDFKYIIFNADGKEVYQCGNGARCFAIYAKEKSLTKKNIIKVETKTKIMTLEIIAKNKVKIDMGEPIFTPELIPIRSKELKQKITILGLDFGVLSMGNPHAITICDDLINKDIKTIAKNIQKNELFPEGVNVGFMQIINKEEIILRVYERGSGETYACGSGACAAVVYGNSEGLLNNEVKVSLKGGNAIVRYDVDEKVLLTGPAEFVFEGSVDI